MMVLRRAVRDSGFVEHRSGESVTVINKTQRSNFDDAWLLNVAFENGVRGVVLDRDVEEVGPLPVPGR